MDQAPLSDDSTAITMPDKPQNQRAAIGLTRLLHSASVELSPGDGQGIQLLPEYFHPGTLVHITFLPKENSSRIVETAVALARGGFLPVPHVAARSLTSRAELENMILRAVGEAGVDRVLLIGGDTDHPRGPFKSSMDVLQTGILQKCGIKSVAFAGHPEGHPAVDAEIMARALGEKVQFALAEGLSTWIINQLCFEAEPVVRWIDDLRAGGITAPVRLGIAGPTNALAMLRFALRCGVGNSVRTLRKRADTVSHLLRDVDPGELLREICLSLPDAGLNGVEGVHFFVFGSLRKMGQWLQVVTHDLNRPEGV